MSRARIALVVALAALIAGVAVWLSFEHDESDGVAVAGSSERGVVPRDTTSPPEVVTEAAAVADSRDVVDIDATPPPAATPEPTKLLLELHGRVTLFDAEGVELPASDGEFRLTVWRGGFGNSTNVAFYEGAWSASVDNTGDIDGIGVSRVASNGLRATVDKSLNKFLVPESRYVDFSARFPRDAVLRVVDDESDADLSGVVLVTSGRAWAGTEGHPGLDYGKQIFASDLRSPIDVGSRVTEVGFNGGVFLLVGVEGYAWMSVRVDLDNGGTQVVRMQRGAALDVIVSGVDAKAHERLRLRTSPESGVTFDEALVNNGLISFDGLHAGPHTVRAEVGESHSDPRVVGEAAVDLSAGQRARVELALAPVPTVERADASGLVFLPVEWHETNPVLTLKLLDTSTAGFERHTNVDGQPTESIRVGFAAVRWKARGVQVGRYQFSVFEPPCSVVIDVPAGGHDEFELVVPPPTELRVYVVDDASGDAVLTVAPQWYVRWPEGVAGGGSESATLDTAARCFVIRAPACAIELNVHSWDYQVHTESVDLATVRERTIRLRPACGIELVVKCGDESVAIPGNWRCEPHALTGSGRYSMSTMNGTQRKVMVSEPGTYSIEMPKIVGYVQSPVQTIEVFAGRYTEHVVQLERVQR